MLALLSGGTGTPKLLQGLKQVLGEEEIAVIVNTSEDEWLPHGYFSPDVDTVLYTLSGQINEETWYGIKGDTFFTHEQLNNLRHEEVLRIGDRDRATHIQRGQLLRSGKTLSQAIEVQRKRLGVRTEVYPMSDDEVRTVVATDEGEMGLHEFLIAHRGKPRVSDVYHKSADNARACEKAVEALKKADSVIIGPSNPISSILPITSLSGMQEALINKRSKCLAVSPIVGGKVVSGPAAIFMQAKGLEVCSKTVAQLYSEFIGSIILDESEDGFKVPGVKCFKGKTMMHNLEDKKALARFALEVLAYPF
ncbi:MAG: 2-phospho-L-lactate transferase [Candidatus Hydrothermarchaeales archaeon]